MKLAIIMRGIPGSGKSTIANLLRKRWGATVHSTDHYHICNGVYEYKLERVAEFHQLNYEAFSTSCRRGDRIVISDNTNIWPHLYECYVSIAKFYGYKVLQIKLRDASRVSIHNVPEEVVNRMRTAFATYFKMRGADSTLIINAQDTLNDIYVKVKRKLRKLHVREVR